MTTRNPITAIAHWLRSGYPDGVPPTDFIPLVALLNRTLDPDELTAAVNLVTAEHPGVQPSEDDVRSAIARVKAAPPVDADIHAVAARLASVGWPLGHPEPGTGTVSRVIAWLRAGYPSGIPPIDRIPVFAILSRRLTGDEVKTIAERLITDADGRPISATDAAVLITRATDDVPSEEELDRVRERLAAQGWPLQR
jgi:hypothetical protein